MNPDEAYKLALENGPSKELEEVISKNARLSYQYAKFVLKGPFPAGEKRISFHCNCSYLYALDVLKGRFALGEASIAENPYCAFVYARDVLKGRFALGEKAIATGTSYSFGYALHVLKGRFALGEKLLSVDPYHYYDYAIYVIKGVFELAEPDMIKHGSKIDTYFNPESLDYQFRFNRDICSIETIAENPLYALGYAIMKDCRFPEGEPAMKTSPRIWRRYQEFINDTTRSL